MVFRESQKVEGLGLARLILHNRSNKVRDAGVSAEVELDDDV
jgi:hypothetical protein